MNESTRQYILTLGQVRAALVLAGLRPEPPSPLVPLVDGTLPLSAAPGSLDALAKLGWLVEGSTSQLKPEARAALRAVAEPRAIGSLFVGSPDAVGAGHFYGHEGWQSGRLASCAVHADEDRVLLAYPLGPGAVVDALTGQLVPGLLGEPALFQATISPNEFVALAALMDWTMHALLSARLDREPNPVIRFTAQRLWQMLVEGRTAVDLSWMVTGLTYLLPDLDFELDEGQLGEALAALASAGLVTPVSETAFAMAGEVEELATALLPLLGFGALHIRHKEPAGTWRQSSLALLRGLGAIVLAQGVTSAGQPAITVDALSAEELGAVLLSLVQDEGAAPPLACPDCHAPAAPGQRFCEECGSALTPQDSPPRHCPQCGTIAEGQSKFCVGCGSPLAVESNLEA